jgi:hypothetical protein
MMNSSRPLMPSPFQVHFRFSDEVLEFLTPCWFLASENGF